MDHDVLYNAERETFTARVWIMNDNPVKRHARVHHAREPRGGAARDRVACRHAGCSLVERR
jgi:hypothetical protein